jgi:hypothetical protein
MSGFKRYALLLTVLLFQVGAFGQSGDDTMTLVSGEIFHGNLLDIDDSIITFRTRHGSRMYLPFDQIQSMSGAQARSVELRRGETVTGLLSIKERSLVVQFPDAVETINIADVKGVSRIPNPSAQNSAEVETGVFFREGNQSHVDLYARIEIGRVTDSHTWNWEALFALDEADDFPNYARSELEWRGKPYTSWRTFALAGFERDRDAALDARLEAAVGYDYKLLYDNPYKDVRGGIGLGVAHESYDGRNQSTNDTDVDLFLRLIYNSRLRDRLTFSNELRGIPSLTDVGDFRASYDSGLAWSLLDGLELNLQLRIDYDEDPPFADFDQWRAAVGAGVRVRFGTN